MTFTQKTPQIAPAIDQEILLRRMTNRIHKSLELQEILRSTVGEIRTFLKTDRVMVYRFHRDNSGEVIAESIYEDRLPSLLGLNFPADDIPPEARELFIKRIAECVKLSDFSPEREATRRFQPPSIFPSV